MMASDSSTEDDYFKQCEAVLSVHPKADLGPLIAQWPDPESKSEITDELVRIAAYHASYDFAWLPQVLDRLDVTPERRVALLRSVFEDMIEVKQRPCWSDFRQMGFSARELDLRTEKDFYHLGAELDERYQLDQRIAMGGFATVYQAVRLADGERVIAKIPHAPAQDGKGQPADAIRHEAALLRQLQGEGVPQFVELIEGESAPVLLMQRVADFTLEEKIHHETIAVDEALRITAKVACVLDRLHRLNFIHGDIKSDNIMMDTDGDVHLIDFNVSRTADAALSNDRFPGGTLPLMSPESILGLGPDVDLRQDVYAIGHLLYRMLERDLAFDASSREEALVKAIFAETGQALQFTESVPSAVQHMIETAVSRNPNSRFETAADLANACEKFLAGHTTTDGIPRLRPRLTSWRLGMTLGLAAARQQHVLAQLERMPSVPDEEPLPRDFQMLLPEMAAISIGKEEVELLAAKLDIPLPSWPEASQYRIAFYRRSKLRGTDLQHLKTLCEAGQAWCREALAGVEKTLCDRNTALDALFLIATQTRFVPYLQQGPQRWLECSAVWPLPHELIDEFSEACRLATSDCNWIQHQNRLDLAVIAYLRWSTPE